MPLVGVLIVQWCKKKQKEEQEKIKLENKIKKDKEKEAFKKLSKEEKIIFREEQKKNKPIKQVNDKYIEFPYLEELSETQYNKLKNNNWVTVDPGKIIYVFDNQKHK